MSTNGNRNYKNAAERERSIVNKARKFGALSFRSAGSHSPIDVFILDPISKIITLIQCKPKSMSGPAISRLKESLKKYEGIYNVTTEVRFSANEKL